MWTPAPPRPWPHFPSGASIQLRVRCRAEPYGVNNSNDYPDKPETYDMVVLDECLIASSFEMEDEAAHPPPGLSPARPALPSVINSRSPDPIDCWPAGQVTHRQHRWQ
jgi:hypothetical protein